MKPCYLKCPFCNSEILDGAIKCRYCKEDINSAQTPDQKSTRGKRPYVLLIGLILLVASALTYLMRDMPDYSIDSNVQSAVVDIFCPFSDQDFYSDEAEGFWGSGTVYSADGSIITNSHILPQDDDYIYMHEQGCIIIFPAPKTGQPEEIYVAHPLYYGDLSEEYDLALLKIYGPYLDETPSPYPREFISLASASCDMNEITLLDPVQVYGYPGIHGGMGLTVTEGVVSSFKPETGEIITSAQITGGNSGGLALSKGGVCFRYSFCQIY